MRVRSFLAVLFLLSSLNAALAEEGKGKAPSDPQTCAATIQGRTCTNATTAVNVNSPRPVPLYGASTVTIEDVNLFRFDVGTTVTSKPIDAASLPGGLGLTQTQISAIPNAIPVPAAPTPKSGKNVQESFHRGEIKEEEQPPDYPAACDPSTPSWQKDYRKQRLTTCWNGVQHEAAAAYLLDLHNLRQNINTDIRVVAAEQRCYALRLKTFAQPLLTSALAGELVGFAQANQKSGDAGGCYQGVGNDDWPFHDANDLLRSLETLQVRLMTMAALPGYAEWLGPESGTIAKANAALAKSLADMITEVTSYTAQSVTAGGGSPIAQSYRDYITAVDANKAWRLRLKMIADADEKLRPALRVTMSLNDCHEFYGKGRTDTVQLHATDASTAGTQDIPIATNTCMPRTIASTGVGITFLPSPVYGFVPGDATTGTQVIGKTAVNRISPLYAVLYNVQPYKPKCQHSAEFFLSPGIGLTSSSNTTVADFLAGVSVGFARRVVFVTGSIDFGRRDTLLPGFAEGNPKGSLTSIPTRSTWKTGAMLSVTFGIGPS